MPEARPIQTADLRTALLDQLAYLIDEMEALKAVVGRVPPPLPQARPLRQALSLKELYGLFATLDEAVYLPRLRQMIAEDTPAFDAVDEAVLAAEAGWNDQPIDRILERVQEARRGLLAFLHALSPEAWTRAGRFADERRDVYSLAHQITQHDVDLLRTVGHRLHESL